MAERWHQTKRGCLPAVIGLIGCVLVPAQTAASTFTNGGMASAPDTVLGARCRSGLSCAEVGAGHGIGSLSVRPPKGEKSVALSVWAHAGSSECSVVTVSAGGCSMDTASDDVVMLPCSAGDSLSRPPNDFHKRVVQGLREIARIRSRQPLRRAPSKVLRGVAR